jgi:hypothetical protein
VESEKYDTLIVNELFSKLKSAEVDKGMTAVTPGFRKTNQVQTYMHARIKFHTYS